MDCIEENPYYNEPGDPRASYPYVAHLYYDNPYSSTVFLPVDEERNLEERNILYYASNNGKPYAPDQPEYFASGKDKGLFDVYFDGSKVIWALTSGSSIKKAAISSDASEGSARCKQSASGARLAIVPEERNTSALELTEITGYPNPVSDMYYINLNEEMASIIKVNLVDIQGKTIEEAARIWVEQNENIWRNWIP